MRHAATFAGNRAWVSLAIFGAAWLTAAVAARPYPGGWNDRSRLATVESLVDYHTLAIDHSVFTAECGDKLFIHGHFYSDKSPVPALILAVLYWLWQCVTGIT